MSLAALARQMHEAGTPIEGILLALEAVEERDAEAAAKRAKAAARKQAQRDRERDCRVTVTGQSRDRLPSLDKSPQTPKINPTPLVHTHETRTRSAAWSCPEGVNSDHWRDFLGNRRRKKLANSETAHAAVLRDLETLTDADWPPGRLVEHAAAKGWGSINKPEDGYQNGQRRTNSMAGNRGASASGHGTTVDAAQRFLARHTPQFAG